MSVRYRVSMSRPHSHLFELEAHFPAREGRLTVALPVWTPGSYLVREYARHLQDITATTAAGKPLPIQRPDKRSFSVAADGQAVVFRYRVYAHELTVRTSHLDGSHGYWNGATLFLYEESLRHREHRVRVESPDGWRVTTALPRDGGDFVAATYDELVDSPFEVGPHSPLVFQAAGVRHDVVLWGDPQLDEKKLLADLGKIVEVEANLFGGLPLESYVFFVYATDKGRGGLEHRCSSALLFPRASFQGPKGWEDFLTLAAHEYFHLWNVKRIRPQALTPFDYSQEQYTRLLWAFEGITSYYDNLLVRRAGLMSPGRYLTRLGETFTALLSTPGRKVQTLEDASLVSWIKHYRPDEHTPNSAISYYLKGEVVALLLDLEVRRATGDAKSLDDVMRLLWQRYGTDDSPGVPEEGIEAAVAEVAGKSMKPFFDRALRSLEELDYSVLSHVGLEARYRVRESPADKGGSAPRLKASDVKPRGYLGLTFRGAATVAVVPDGTPAQAAGVYPEDELLALDGYRVDGAALVTRCEDKKPGETVRLTLFRRDRLVEVTAVLGSKPADAVYVLRTEKATEAQRAAFQAWLGTPWDDANEAKPQG